MPEVSIILPTYNRAHSIGAAIQSVFEQTYQNFELIVVDDGSTDNTRQLLKEVTDPRLTYVIHNINKGAAAARSTGMRLAKGEYIAFLDSDDTWDPKKLEKQLNFLKRPLTEPTSARQVLGATGAQKRSVHEVHEHSSTEATTQLSAEGRLCKRSEEKGAEIGGCVSYYRLQFTNRSLVRKVPIEADFYQQSLKGCNLSPGSTLIFKKECLNQVGFQDESLRRFEDWEWQIRFARFYRWEMVPEVLADIKVGHTVSFETAKQALIRFEDLTKELPLKDKKIIKMAIYYELFYAAFKNRRFKTSISSIVTLFMNTPVVSIKLGVSIIYRKVKELFSLK